MNQPVSRNPTLQTEAPKWVSPGMVLLGILALLVGIYTLASYLIGLLNLYKVTYIGTDFFYQYLAGSHYTIFLALITIVGGLGLILKRRFGWIMGIASTILHLVLITVSIFFYDLLGGLWMASPLFIFVSFLFNLAHLCLFVFLILPQVRGAFKLQGLHWGLAIAVTFLLLTDYLFSTLVLAPEF